MHARVRTSVWFAPRRLPQQNVSQNVWHAGPIAKVLAFVGLVVQSVGARARGPTLVLKFEALP